MSRNAIKFHNTARAEFSTYIRPFRRDFTRLPAAPLGTARAAFDRGRPNRSHPPSRPARPPVRPQNFAINAAEAQFLSRLFMPDGSLTYLGHVLELTDTTFTVLFTVELLLNIMANWMHDFIYDGWHEPHTPPHHTTPYHTPQPLCGLSLRRRDSLYF
jgi:hypothetical protein